MKNIIISILMGMILLVPLASADQVNMDINVNGTANLNITVDADDTLAREMINDTQEDVYGTMEGSGPKDVILEEIKSGAGNPITETEGLDTIGEICNDPNLQQYLNSISGLPPLGFVDYLKALGYDDEAHINLIWTMCQQEYINQNQVQWSTDLPGFQQADLVSFFQDAINYLKGNGNSVFTRARDLAIVLDSYFASDKDVWILVNKIRELEIRIQVLETTMERVASEAYCQAKIDAMMEYNLTYVKCGENSTIYTRVNADEFGYNIVGYSTETQCNENWACTPWSECKDDIRERTCADVNKCGTTKNKPPEEQACIIIVQEVIQQEPEALTGSFILNQENISNLFSSIQNFLLSEIVYTEGQGFSIK